MLPMPMQNFANPQQANAVGPANTLAALASLGAMGMNARRVRFLKYDFGLVVGSVLKE